MGLSKRRLASRILSRVAPSFSRVATATPSVSRPYSRRSVPASASPSACAASSAADVDLLRSHNKAQQAERETAGSHWVESGLVFPDEHGRSPSHRRDWAEWKALLTEANVRDGRLHDARHTAATVLLILGVPERGPAPPAWLPRFAAPKLPGQDGLDPAPWHPPQLRSQEVEARLPPIRMRSTTSSGRRARVVEMHRNADSVTFDLLGRCPRSAGTSRQPVLLGCRRSGLMGPRRKVQVALTVAWRTVPVSMLFHLPATPSMSAQRITPPARATQCGGRFSRPRAAEVETGRLRASLARTRSRCDRETDPACLAQRRTDDS
ncbi:hypothetical protein BX257_3639 [Streptomyces sp. 3212.3]|nr:hypothetical protein BX257_3639 [Streptomyces sp. 3212.3]